MGGMTLSVNTITMNDGSILKGIFGLTNNMFLGRMYKINPKGTYFFEGQTNVYDRIIDPDGSYCVGQVENGYRKCVDIHGDVMNGLWKNGTFTGRPQKYDEMKL